LEQFKERVRKLEEPGVLFKKLCERSYQAALHFLEEGDEEVTEICADDVENYIDWKEARRAICR
jgi:uncharacterized membrane-anchored protein YjiN (DUF445 family)